MDVALMGIKTKEPDIIVESSPNELSQVLQNLADTAGEKVRVSEICSALGDRSFGAFLLVFCLPNLVPLPPGSSAVLGIPLIIIAFQIMAGHSIVWLPKKLANYSLSRENFQNMIAKINPHLKKGEALVKPRHWPVNQFICDKLFGFFTLVLAIVVTIPIPMGNWPPAFAIAFLAAAYTKRDGLFLGIGAILGLASLALAGSVIVGAIYLFFHMV